ncbi:MAG TPA: flavin reductase [Nocardioidaceae bacterium]|nr:flavin reductase [Nocardioidaceae bacterium]
MTIHDEHPFADPEPERDPVRRFRGRLGGTVTVLTAGAGAARAGLTVSSLMVAHGDPGHVLALVDPESELAAAVARTGAFVVGLLEWRHHGLAQAFAGTAPAPGGVFTLGSWSDSAWGPVLQDASAWAGARLAGPPRELGWSLLLDGTLERIELGETAAPLVHRRGRYQRPDATGSR